MMKLEHNFKKGMALVLTLVMAAGLVPAMSDGADTVQAATGTGKEPSVTAYATKDQLMTAFTPDANGTATTKGKLVFGKNSDGNPQEWYILGADSGVSGGKDNTIIFAASPIARGQKFNSDRSNKNDENLWSDCVYSEKTITEVYAHHYGASELRDTLQGMATNKSYFTSAEQGLMNATTVTTKDTKNKDSSGNYLTYTTTDKLYALQGDFDNDKYLWAGTDDSTVLAMSSYWRNGDLFWLRSPNAYQGRYALLANPGDYVNYYDVDDGYAVRPASNLNLSSVLFASAAKAASSGTEWGTIAEGTAMTLRLAGTGKNIGTVTYDTRTGDIKAVKGSTSQTVALVVQGKDGTKDWFYSKTIAASETINTSTIKSTLALSSDIDLSACKIWLEITDTDGLAYAVGATEDTSTSPDTMPIYVKTPDGNFLMLEIAKTATISAVKEGVFDKKGISVDEQQLLFNGEVLEDGKTLQDYSIGKDSTLQLKYVVKNVNATINTPKGGLVLDTNVTCAMNEIKSATLNWTDTGNNPVSGNANYYPWCYKAHVTLMPNDGYAVTDATEVHINNNATEEKTINTDGSITVTCCFYSNQDKLTGITAPSPITTGNGAEKTVAGLGLPSQVDITTVEGAASKADVVWDLENLASGTYNPSFLTEQIFTVNGTVTLPEEVGNTDNISLNITIQVTVSAAGIVGAPTANPTAGTYSENQSVTLTSSTVGATIYYTTDGSEPTITGGAPDGTTQQYTAPILVTGTVGQSITTTIKAIAVQNGMQDSSVETFTYTIQIPVPKYTVTVTNGSGTGQYAQGETVTITAGAAPSGQQFKEWEVVSGTITLASSTSETTTFTMPTEAVSVKANYEAIPVTGYTITATAGANGSITPSGAVGVAAGGSQTFTISPSSGYVLDTLKVDGLEVTATTSYTFSDVNANHTIEVTFKQESQTPDVTAPSITTQPGNATVKAGETATFTIAASGTDLTYQWQIDRNDGNGWVNIDGATVASYTTSTVDISCNGFKYQCVVSNSAGTDTSNTAVLTVTENTTPAPGSVDYEILDGANTSWEQNSDGSLSIRGSGAISKFVGVKVDGNLVDVKNYTVKEGSTIVTLKADYLNTISVGNHTFEIIWTDGTASTRFTVSKSDSGSAEPKDNDGNNGKNDNTNNTPATVPEDKNNNGTSGSQTDDNQQITSPKTGDNSHTVLWISLLGVSLAGLLSMIYVRKKKENE